jgi:hypothetical protein
MSPLVVFVLRLSISAGVAVLISRFFFKSIAPVKIALLAAVLMGLAYIHEYFRKRKGGDGND